MSGNSRAREVFFLSMVAACDGAVVPRRAFCGGLSALACGVGLRPAIAAPKPMLRDGDAVRCENGVGAACDAAAEGNELIQKLQERSRANRARNEEDVQERSTRNIGYDGAR